MSVNIVTPNPEMSQSLNSLKQTASSMHLHRVWVTLSDVDTWYKVIREANAQYGRNNWRGQSHVKRKLEANHWVKRNIKVWFDVPDVAFATWVSVKHGVIASVEANK